MRHAWFIFVFLGLSFGLNAQSPQESTAKVQAKINALEKALDKISNNIKKQQKDLTSSEKNLAQTDKSINEITNDIKKTKNTIIETKLKIDQLNGQLKTFKEENQVLIKRLEKYVKQLHHHQKDHPIKLIMQQDKLSDVQKLSVWYEYFANSEAKLLKEVKEKTEQATKTQEKLYEEEQQLLSLGQTFKKQQLALQEKRKAQVAQVDAYRNQIKQKKLQKNQIHKQHQSLTKLLAELKKASKLEYIDIPNEFATMVGRLPMPIPKKDLKRSALAHSYLEANEGTQVRAIHPGRVVFSEWLRGLGLLLIIDHGQGYMSLYGNNQVLFKSTGDWVNQGDQIALVGKSGGLSKPGLYFEIRKDGAPLDTDRWISQG